MRIKSLKEILKNDKPMVIYKSKFNRKDLIFDEYETFNTETKIDKIIEEMCKQEEERRKEKINGYVYNFIKANYTPYDIKFAFSSYNRFKEFINDVEVKLIEDGGIYRL